MWDLSNTISSIYVVRGSRVSVFLMFPRTREKAHDFLDQVEGKMFGDAVMGKMFQRVDGRVLGHIPVSCHIGLSRENKNLN